MSTSREIRVLHLEPTDVCQAACPLCERELDPKFDKNQHQHLTVAQIQDHFDLDQIAQLDKMFMCGSYGDPAAGRHTLEIYQWFRAINTEITLGMNTNGALQNTAWWQVLGELFHRQLDYVVFSIDGLEDTNSIYRRGVNWSRLMQNVQAYIGTGASAHWDMLVYQHNQHQVDACRELARDMGFTWFRAKVSKRPLIDGLKHPVGWQAPSSHSRGEIRCQALAEKSAYIDARGRLSPCCWIGADRNRDHGSFEHIQTTWNTTQPDSVCQDICRSDGASNVFLDQWQQNIQLK